MNTTLRSSILTKLFAALLSSGMYGPLLAQPVDQDSISHYSEDFSNGLSGWSVSNGVWEAGTPDSSSETPFPRAGRLAGTVINGNHPAPASSRLVSPPIQIDSADVQSGFLLRFYMTHWHRMNDNAEGRIQISLDGVNWDDMPGARPLSGNSQGRVSTIVPDISQYIGTPFYLGFQFVAGGPPASLGWYVDEVHIYSQPPAGGGEKETFTPPVIDWTTENTLWHIEKAPGNHPDDARTGVAGTVIGGVYDNVGEARLISPFYTVLDGSIRQKLRFQHWFDLAEGDSARVQMALEGDTTWNDLPGASPFSGKSGGWTKFVIPELGLTPGDRVRFAFLLTAQNPDHDNEGWYIDDFEVMLDMTTVLANAATLTYFDPFEPSEITTDQFGPRTPNDRWEWYSDNGIWQVDSTETIPAPTLLDPTVAGTILEGNYPNDASSRFVSPPVFVEDLNFKLEYTHWFDFGNNSRGLVQISIDNGPWLDLKLHSNSSVVWSTQGFNVQTTLDPDSSWTVEGNVRIGFLFESDPQGATHAGWYIGHIILEKNGVRTAVEPLETPQRATLHQNYPNPFNPNTTIGFNLEAPGTITLKVFDILGREVSTLVDAFLPAGAHSRAWHAADQASGVYFYQLQTGESTITRRMLLVK